MQHAEPLQGVFDVVLLSYSQRSLIVVLCDGRGKNKNHLAYVSHGEAVHHNLPLAASLHPRCGMSSTYSIRIAKVLQLPFMYTRRSDNVGVDLIPSNAASMVSHQRTVDGSRPYSLRLTFIVKCTPGLRSVASCPGACLAYSLESIFFCRKAALTQSRYVGPPCSNDIASDMLWRLK